MTAHAHPERHDHEHTDGSGTATAVLEVSGVQWATSKNVAEAVLSRRPGVHSVEANPVAQTATVTYDPNRTNLAELRDWVRECGFHCAGQSVPQHVCDPMTEPTAAPGLDERVTHDAHAGHAMAPASPVSSPHDAM